VNCALDVIDSEVRVLLETIQDQSRRRWFKYISPQKVDWYNAPEQFFPASSKAFPSATHDIQEACCSFALERYTACVFHCMGIFQRGLYAFAQEKDIQVSFPFPIELAEWKNIIDNIESKIRALESLPKGQQKDEKLKFYSDAAVQFRYFKDAWRNHIAHFREQYDEHMALSILIHVRDFIEHLSTRLSELPVPGSTQPETLP
jgi:hypothetical protein